MEEAANGSADIGTCGTGSMWTGKISTTLREVVSREKSMLASKMRTVQYLRVCEFAQYNVWQI